MPILGTSPDAIDLAEDRDRFKALVDRLGLKQPESGIARTPAEARSVADRLGYPGDDPPVLRAGRPGHGDRRRRRRDRPLRGAAVRHARSALRARRVRQAPAADRPLSGRCHRGRRRLPLRRPRHLHRRHHGAHRGGRHPFRRQRLLAARPLARVLDPRAPREADARPGAGPQRGRADERAVRGQGPRDLHPRGQPARLAHRAVRRQGDRQADRRHRRAHHERRAARLLQAASPGSSATSPSRRRCFRSRASPASTPSWGPRCARPAR